MVTVSTAVTRGLQSRDALLIPRIIHRVWLGNGEIPEALEAFGQTWAEHHPEWEMKLWRDADLPLLANQRQFDEATSPAQRSDIARYEILLQHGGVYVDTDFECLRNLDDLLTGVEAFIGSEDGRHLSIGIMGAVPGHPLFQAIVEALPGSLADDPTGPPNERTGPHLATRVVAANRALRESLLICEPELFYPYLYNEQYRRNDPFPDAYAVHHWSASWLGRPVPQVPPRYRAVVALDWSAPAAAKAVLGGFAQIFKPADPVELAITLAHEPGAGDVERARSLLAEMGIDPHECASITIESFEESAHAPYDVAVVPGGNLEALVMEVGEAIGSFHTIRAQIESYGRPAFAAACGESVLSGDVAGLHRRLSAFRPTIEPSPSANPRCPTVLAGAHRATYVGQDRLLVSTNWGGKLFMSATDLSLTPEVVHDGNYDDPFTAFVTRTLRPGDVVFDVGANVGLFTLLMARLVGPEGHVVAYEAAPANLALLRDNVAMNYHTEWVDIVAKAAADSSATLTFHASTRFLGNGSLLPHNDDYQRHFPVDGEITYEVAAEPLDVHLGRFASIQLVKIDVEGAEEKVLAGMEGLIASGAVQRICLELLRARMDTDWAPMAARLHRLVGDGWTLATLDAAGGAVPITLDRVLGHGSFSQLLLERPFRQR